MPIVTEIMDPRDVQVFLDKKIDVMQIGARNAQNFPLLKEVGKTQTPILLKRGMSGTVDELLMAAEYIMSEGNDNVILCERGIRTFETRTRNTFDLNAVPVLHHLSHLPVVADPSHATGYTRYVEPMALAATGLRRQRSGDRGPRRPSHAWSDGAQALTPDQSTTPCAASAPSARSSPRDRSGVAHGYGEKRTRQPGRPQVRRDRGPGPDRRQLCPRLCAGGRPRAGLGPR